MDPLRQRLKELDRDKFEDLCVCLLKERHPNANIRHVEGASGDCGVDAFAGDLLDDPTIWQAKSFPNGVRKSQKEQIRASLREAVKHFKPRRWVLCLSVDMDVHAHRWFEQLQRSYDANKTAIGLWQASDILSELLHRKSIRERFFPEIGLAVNELRALITRTGEYTTEQLANLTTENANQYLERLKAHDARFNYELVITTDRHPATSKGSVFSVTMGSTVVNAYARDVEALRRDPPRITFQVLGAGVSKFQEFVRTGHSQDFAGDEIKSLHTDLSLPDLQTDTIESLHIGRAFRKRRLPVRVTFGTASNGVVYEMVRFRFLRAGTEEVELISKSKLPFLLRVTIRQANGTFRIIDKWRGARFTAVKKYLDALAALKETNELELYDLEDGRRICRARVAVDVPIPSLQPQFVALITAGARVAQAFGTDLSVPARLSPGDAEALAFLVGLLDGNLAGVDDITTTFLKDGTEECCINDIANDQPVNLTLPHPGMKREFAGTNIFTGPMDLHCGAVRFSNPEETLREYQQTHVGAIMTVRWIPLSTIGVQLHTRIGR